MYLQPQAPKDLGPHDERRGHHEYGKCDEAPKFRSEDCYEWQGNQGWEGWEGDVEKAAMPHTVILGTIQHVHSALQESLCQPTERVHAGILGGLCCKTP